VSVWPPILFIRNNVNEIGFPNILHFLLFYSGRNKFTDNLFYTIIVWENDCFPTLVLSKIEHPVKEETFSVTHAAVGVLYKILLMFKVTGSYIFQTVWMIRIADRNCGWYICFCLMVFWCFQNLWNPQQESISYHEGRRLTDLWAAVNTLCSLLKDNICKADYCCVWIKQVKL